MSHPGAACGPVAIAKAAVHAMVIDAMRLHSPVAASVAAHSLR